MDGDLRNRIETRIANLRREYESGQKVLAGLESQRAGLKQTLLQIEGALQVLSELLEDRPVPPETGTQANGARANVSISD